MDKVSLYKIPKDILVELVCKNFSNFSVEELGEIYRNRCIDEINKIKEILTTYHIKDLIVECRGDFIHLDASEDFHYEIDFLDYIIHSEDDEIHCENLAELFIAIHKIVSVRYTEEICLRIMNLIQKIIATYNNKKKLKKFIRNNNLYV